MVVIGRKMCFPLPSPYPQVQKHQKSPSKTGLIKNSMDLRRIAALRIENTFYYPIDKKV